MQREAGRARFERLDSLWVGLFFLLVYEVLRQKTVYGDGIWILHYGWSNVVTSNVHLLYLPLLRGLRWLLDPLGVTVFQITSHLSCIATAVGIGLAHTAFAVLRLSRRDAILAASLVGTAPGIVFYATVVEWQPLFFGLAGVAFVAAARMAVLPTPARAVQLGLGTGIAYLAHASGLLLPIPLLLMVLARVRTNGGPAVSRCLALTLLAHAAVVWGIPALLAALSDSIQANVGHAREMFSVYAETERWRHLSAVLETVWNEWLRAFAPISVVCALGLFSPRTRRMAVGLVIALVPYLTVSVFMLAGHDEYGAYLLPLAWPAAWITMRCITRPLAIGCALLAAIVSVATVKAHDEPERSLEYAAGLREVAGGKPMAVLIGWYPDLEACFVRLPEVPYVALTVLAQGEPTQVRELLPLLDRHLDGWLDEGRRVFLTDQVEEVVRKREFAGYATLDEVLLDHLRSRYRLTPVAHGAFSGKELHKK